ncbi:hypothetical protein D9758_000565 [Tetrapyrgos nigripes]|uniref:FAD-binding domain-containing protein n=1 Tax=Tetrapyrgos nigripes TaxID=182062 RepID=A0A8H5LZ67_9AGAR|nr:hypothetical protein D9758_000565 [Tetrapyrgos nigripes]
MSGKDFNVAIIGGGLCGLAAAVPLFRAGIRVQVFENAPEFSEVGAGVGMGPNSVRALDSLGLLPAIVARSEQAGPKTRVFNFVSGYDRHEQVFDARRFLRDTRCPLLIHYQTTNPSNVGLGIYRQFNKRCTSITTSETGTHIVHFADRSTYEADLVIGADGIKSVTRDYVIGDKDFKPLKYTHTEAYRALVPHQDLVNAGVKTDLQTRPVCFVGLGGHLICFPIKDNSVINFVAFVSDHDTPWVPELTGPWVTPSSPEELKGFYKGFGPDVMTILDHMKEPSRWSVHAMDPPLQSFVRDKVVLVGDAAHPMLPHLGAGVGQGIEDVLVLTQLLTRPQTKKSNLSDVLAQYNKVRPPRANWVLNASTRAGEKYDAFHSTKNDTQTTAKLLDSIWEPVWNYDLKKDIEDSIHTLEEKGIFEK